MKKTMIFVSAVVVMAMSAMFVACNSKNDPVNNSGEGGSGSLNGCTCTQTYEGQSETRKISLAEMQQYGYDSCSDIVSDFYKMVQEEGISGASMSCKGY